MANYQDEGEKDANEEQLLEGGALSGEEEGFIKGYSQDEEIEECAECGAAIDEEKKVVSKIKDEEYHFCSKECAKEFVESTSND
jgi:hypothetical protein